MIRRMIFLFMALAGALNGDGAAAEPVTLPSGLVRDLEAAGPGATLLLAPGEYGTLDLYAGSGFNIQFPGEVTIKSADPTNVASFSGVRLTGVQNLTFDNVKFDYTFKEGDMEWQRPFDVTDSQNITLKNSIFDGDVAQGVSETADGYGYGIGLSVRSSSNIQIMDNEFFNFHRGMTVFDSQSIVVSGNDLHSMRSDGLNFAQLEGVVIEGNHIHDFQTSVGSNDHADMIQFWTSGTTAPSRDIVIRNNVLNSGGGGWTQSIFIRNELVDQGKAGSEMLYRNIRIEGNVIFNAHLHGITVGETVCLMIANNTLIQNVASKGPDDNPSLWTPAITVTPVAIDVTITRNVVPRIAGHEGQADWRVIDNVLIQNQTRAEGGFYDGLFVAASTGDPGDLASIAYRSDGPLHGTGLGSPRLDTALPVIKAGRP